MADSEYYILENDTLNKANRGKVVWKTAVS